MMFSAYGDYWRRRQQVWRS